MQAMGMGGEGGSLVPTHTPCIQPRTEEQCKGAAASLRERTHEAPAYAIATVRGVGQAQLTRKQLGRTGGGGGRPSPVADAPAI